MSETASSLVAALGPLHSPEARHVMWALAHKADDDGRCGIIPLAELGRLCQLRIGSISKILNDLEDLYGLVHKIEGGPSQPSEFRLNLDRLASPHAHIKTDTTTFKAVRGPVAGQRFPVPDIPDDQRHAIVSNPTGSMSVPLIYYIPPIAAKGNSTGRVIAFLPAYMTQRVDDLDHIYRLSSRTWQYTGISVDILLTYGASPTTVKRLKDADVLSMQELDHKIGLWKLRSDSDTPDLDTLGPALLDMHPGRHYVDTSAAVPLKTGGARTALTAHRAWREQTTTD